MIKTVIKRNGMKEDFIPSKLNYWGKWASENLNERLDWSTVILEAVKGLKEEVTSKDLQNKLIEVCLSKKDWPHSLMAGRLFSAMLQKELYGYTMPTIKDLHKRLVKMNLMKKLDYSYDEYEQIEKFIDHNRDFEMAYFQLDYILSKYSIRNRNESRFLETPQYTYMRMTMAILESENKDIRIQRIKELYDLYALGKMSSPTPDYVNLGTNHNGYASCCLYVTDDNAESLSIGDHIAYRMTCMSAGIGGLINTRTINDPVKNGLFVHQGKMPYFKAVGGAVSANKQGGRGGAGNEYYTCYDPEASIIVRLQNPKSTDAKKNRDLHFTMIINRLFAKKVANNENIFTFTSYSAPDLWKYLFSGDQDKFEELYEEYENNDTFVKNYVNARSLLVEGITQSYEVGTHYLAFIDEMNRHTPFIEPIHSSNLCVEIALPTSPYHKMMDLYSQKDNGYIKYEQFDSQQITRPYSERVVNSDGKITFAGNLREGKDVKKIISIRPTSEVALCSLSAIVISRIESDEEYENVSYYALKKIGKSIHMSDYVLPHVGYTAKQRMNAGVGIMGLAHHMAKKGLRYDSKEGLEEIHRVAERHMYFLIKASLRIARETQVAPWIHKTKWAEGWLPIDTYKKTVDSIVNTPLQYDWESLRQEIIDNGGIAHSSLVAHMPTESSSKPIGVPNGVYPIRELFMKKSDQSTIIDWAAIDGDLLEKDYQIAWNIPTKDLIKVYAVLQKFCDQSISADLYENRTDDINVRDTKMIEEFLMMMKYGMKTRYYQNSLVSNVDAESETKTVATLKAESCSSGVCDA